MLFVILLLIFALNSEFFVILQSVQLIVVDWLLGVRTVAWEGEVARDCDTLTVAPPHVLQGFQHDLALLRKLVHYLPVSTW